MDWTLTAGIGLTIWAVLIVLSNERWALEAAKKNATPAFIPPSEPNPAKKH